MDSSEVWEAVQQKLIALAHLLKEQSKAICDQNGCDDEEHFCECYAYVNSKYDLLDICVPDFFTGTTKPHTAIPLPWDGDWQELKNKIDDDIATQYCQTRGVITMDEIKTFEEVARRNGMDARQTLRFCAYMRARWALRENEFCTQFGYADDWAARFIRGVEYQNSDLEGQRVLDRINGKVPSAGVCSECGTYYEIKEGDTIVSMCNDCQANLLPA